MAEGTLPELVINEAVLHQHCCIVQVVPVLKAQLATCTPEYSIVKHSWLPAHQELAITSTECLFGIQHGVEAWRDVAKCLAYQQLHRQRGLEGHRAQGTEGHGARGSEGHRVQKSTGHRAQKGTEAWPSENPPKQGWGGRGQGLQLATEGEPVGPG